MITGAYAVSYFGLPRATHDLDIVIEINPADIERVVRKFSREYVVDKGMTENAVQYRTHFSIIHIKTDLKIDLWILKETASEIEKFARRKKVSLLGVLTYIISAEDMIITKLEWFKRSKNTKHLDDAVGIIKVQSGRLNRKYIKQTVKKLGIKKYWDIAAERSSL
jgi:hypothetical protein